MSRLTDKMNELQKKFDILSIYEFSDILRTFGEDDMSSLLYHDIIVYLNEEKTKCLTVVLYSSATSIQLIEENVKGGNPTFLSKNLTFNETVRLVKTILRSYKIKKLQNGKSRIRTH